MAAAGTVVDKPGKIQIECLDYHECIHYIEAKYGINTRDYAGRFSKLAKEYDEDKSYLDFWHWLLDNDFMELHNGSIQTLFPDTHPNAPEWVQEILGLIVLEFLEDGEDSIEFWVEW